MLGLGLEGKGSHVLSGGYWAFHSLIEGTSGSVTNLVYANSTVESEAALVYVKSTSAVETTLVYDVYFLTSS
jgi:hypothetical protein